MFWFISSLFVRSRTCFVRCIYVLLAPIIELLCDWFFLFKGSVEHKQYDVSTGIMGRESALIKKEIANFRNRKPHETRMRAQT